MATATKVNIIPAEKIVNENVGGKVSGFVEITHVNVDPKTGNVEGFLRANEGNFGFIAFSGSQAANALKDNGKQRVVRFQSLKDRRGKEILLSLVKIFELEG